VTEEHEEKKGERRTEEVKGHTDNTLTRQTRKKLDDLKEEILWREKRGVKRQ